MARLIRPSMAFLAIAAFVAAFPHAVAAQAGSAPTFAKDVAPIFNKNCVVCHRAGEAVPFALTSYDEARPWARSIKKRVIAREMPPWFADPQYGHFSNDRRLSQQEIDTIAAWADAGAPKGREADLPPVPTFATGWLHPGGAAPDAVIEMPVEFKTPGTGEIPVTTFYTPVPFAEDKFVEATQVKPGNQALVHHVIVRGLKQPAGSKIDQETGLLVNAQTGKPFAEQIREENVNEEPTARAARLEREALNRARAQDVFDSSASIWLSTYAPGWTFEKYRPGIGKRVPAGWLVGFNEHYTPTGRPETDRTSIGLWFQKVPLQKELFQRFVGDSYIVEGQPLVDEPKTRRPKIPNIPPYAENWSIVGVTPVLEPIAIYSFIPHMHLRGHDLKYVAVYPDGREETLMSAPKFDFNWQLFYENDKPVRLPAGSKIMALGHYDNSIKNKFNPAPDKEVYWSEQSWDEMFQGYMQFTKDTAEESRTLQQQH